jgi:hypothetical protein
MKSKVLFSAAALLLVLSAKGWTADILGNWIAQIPGGRTTGGTVIQIWSIPGETVFSFKANGTKLTGTVSDPHGETAIREGEIHGDEISFIVIGGAAENGITFLYKGKVGLNEIEFTRKPKDGTEPKQEFIARREFLRHNDYIPRPVMAPVSPPPR